MSAAVFFRLLQEEEKGEALARAIARLADGEPAPGVYVVEEDALRAIPESPFAYWVSERLLRAFRELPPFEGDGRTARVGLQTSDDFRFLRLWWEAPAWNIASSRAETLAGKRWVAFAKGGEFSPYYADVHLVVNWAQDGAEIRSFSGPGGRLASRPQNADFYFRPGLTWPLRTNGFSVRALPGGCIFAHKGPAVFVSDDDEQSLLFTLAVMNSAPFLELIRLRLARVDLAQSFEVGLIQETPFPTADPHTIATMAALARTAHQTKIEMALSDETTHVFTLPALARCRSASLKEAAARVAAEREARAARLAELQAEIDREAERLYGFSAGEAALDAQLGSAAPDGAAADDEAEPDEERVVDGAADAADLVMWCAGCVFGRWDVRLALDPSRVPPLPGPFDPLPRCAPGALTGADGLPAGPGNVPPDYPLRIDWDGILVDDPEHADDIARRVRDVLAVIWQERAAASEEEICEALGARTLADYLRRPAGFFAHHLQRYSKSRRQAPIYWPLSTESGSYTLWLYYHRLTSDTLYTAVNRYVSPKIEAAQRELAQIERQLAAASGSEATRLRGQREARQRLLDELEAFRDELLRVAALPYRPDLDDGVIINAAPLWRLFRLPKWRKATRETWEKLERGDYDWAHLAYQIWPERVREKCRADRSLAIAHGLAKASEVPAADTGRARGRQRQQVATVLGVEDEELQVPGAGSPRETGEQ